MRGRETESQKSAGVKAVNHAQIGKDVHTDRQ